MIKLIYWHQLTLNILVGLTLNVWYNSGVVQGRNLLNTRGVIDMAHIDISITLLKPDSPVHLSMHILMHRFIEKKNGGLSKKYKGRTFTCF